MDIDAGGFSEGVGDRNVSSQAELENFVSYSIMDEYRSIRYLTINLIFQDSGNDNHSQGDKEKSVDEDVISVEDELDENLDNLEDCEIPEEQDIESESELLKLVILPSSSIVCLFEYLLIQSECDH